MELRIINGKWRQVYPNGKWHSASGAYVFVIEDGKIYAQHQRFGVGHTEVARGERVSWAGEVEISGNSGQVRSWNDGSGHYRPASSLRETAVKAGLPAEKFQQHPDTAVRPRTADTLPQLPVDQPRTRSTTGRPAVIGHGPPRLEEMERDMRAGRTPTPAGSTPAGAASTDTRQGAGKVAIAPSKGEATVDRVSFAYDTEAADTSKTVQLRGIALEDYPVDRPGLVTRFFQDRPVLKKAAGAGVSVGAAVVTDVVLSVIDSHFAHAAELAAAEVESTFPTTEQILADYQISARKAAYDTVMKGLSNDRSRAAVDAGMSDVFEYQDALDDVIGSLDRSQSQADGIVADLSMRSHMLNQVGQDFEKTFVWIQQHVPVLWVYYQSFTLWHAREIFLGLSARIDHVIALLNRRISAYQDLYETLSSRLGVVDEDIGRFREYADRVTKATPNR